MLIPKVIRPRNHPFPFLLYVEWALLGLAILNEFTPRPLPQSQEYSIFIIGIILSFGILGLRIPTHPLSLKLTYEILQFGLVTLAGSLSIFKVRLLPMLYIVVVLRSSLIFPLRGRLVVTAISFLCFVGMAQIQVQMFSDRLPASLVQEILPQITAIRLNIIIMFLLLLVFLLWLINALLAERQQQDQLREANQKLKDAVAQIEKLAMAQERTRIAQEIHDALGHALTGLNIQLEGALKLWEINPEQSKELVTQAKKMGSMALNETRQAVASLREAPLQEQQDLLTAIVPLLQDFEQMTGILPHVTLDTPQLSPPLRLMLYRIVQESLTNICKYAQADRVDITLEPITERLLDSPSPQHYLALTVQDNGVGFHPEHNTTGFGLQGIRERAIAAGGTAEFISAPGQGCTVKVCLPMNNEFDQQPRPIFN